ncbi:MAG: hypothetical protein NT030_06740 [Candidatus Saganbacteria bacterium]|nr:hypothetical protein [Candidatus Saganbacteria bacterium]
MKIRQLFLFIIVILLMYYLVRIFFPDIFWEKVKIIDRVFVPQGRVLYIKDVKSGLITELVVDGSTITDFYQFYDQMMLFSAYYIQNKQGLGKIFFCGLTDGKTRVFYSFNKNNLFLDYVLYMPKEDILLALGKINEKSFLFIVNRQSPKKIHIRQLDYGYLNFIDSGHDRVLISNLYGHYYVSYYYALGIGRGVDLTPKNRTACN